MNIAMNEDAAEGRALPPDVFVCLHEMSPEYRMRIFVRHDGAQARFVSDEGEVGADAVEFDVSFFSTQDEADRVAHACCAYLIRSGMGPDDEGWHAIPQATHRTLLPTLLGVARKMAWSCTWPSTSPAPLAASIEPKLSIAPATEGGPPPMAEVGAPLVKDSRRWSLHRMARFAFKMGQGMSAKQVAFDPEIRSTPDACYQRARELGLSFREVPTGQVSMRLPLGHLVVIDRAAAAKGMTRDAFLESWLKQAAADPARYGLIAV